MVSTYWLAVSSHVLKPEASSASVKIIAYSARCYY